MGSIKKIVILILMAISLSFCVSKQRNQMEFQEEITDVYFQEVVGDELDSGSEIHFYIEFRKPLAKKIVLKKIYFNNLEASFKTEDNQHFVAHLYRLTTELDLILDRDSLKEYGNSAPLMVKAKFDLKENEAVLEYQRYNQTFFDTIKSIKEKPIIPSPSGIKPKN